MRWSMKNLQTHSYTVRWPPAPTNVSVLAALTEYVLTMEPITEGVACIMPEYVRTFYPVKATLIARHGGEAGYFAHECGRVQL